MKNHHDRQWLGFRSVSKAKEHHAILRVDPARRITRLLQSVVELVALEGDPIATAAIDQPPKPTPCAIVIIGGSCRLNNELRASFVLSLGDADFSQRYVRPQAMQQAQKGEDSDLTQFVRSAKDATIHGLQFA